MSEHSLAWNPADSVGEHSITRHQFTQGPSFSTVFWVTCCCGFEGEHHHASTQARNEGVEHLEQFA